MKSVKIINNLWYCLSLSLISNWQIIIFLLRNSCFTFQSICFSTSTYFIANSRRKRQNIRVSSNFYFWKTSEFWKIEQDFRAALKGFRDAQNMRYQILLGEKLFPWVFKYNITIFSRRWDLKKLKRFWHEYAKIIQYKPR